MDKTELLVKLEAVNFRAAEMVSAATALARKVRLTHTGKCTRSMRTNAQQLRDALETARVLVDQIVAMLKSENA